MFVYLFVISYRYDFKPTQDEKEAIRLIFGDMKIKEDCFVQTAPVYEQNSPRGVPIEPVLNPQTVHLCETLGIDDPLQVAMARAGRVMQKVITTGKSTNTTVIPDTIKTKEMATPIQNISLSLPAPVSLSLDTYEEILDKTSTACTPDNSSFMSDSTSALQFTPVSTGKKTFKRRNEAIYTPGDIDKSADTSSSVLDAESPSPSKLLYMPNPRVHTGED